MNQDFLEKNFTVIKKGSVSKVSSVCLHSSQVKKDSLFVAIKGREKDGHDYLDEACKLGAQFLLVEDTTQVPNSFKGTLLQTKNTLNALSSLLNEFHSFPSEKMFVVGVTGTNGKTTISSMIHHIFSKCGWATGLLGTIEQKFKDKTYTSRLTTPDAVELFARLRDFLDNSAQAVVMEVSSISLDQKRVKGVDFNLGIFSNLTQDHLDYHQDFKSYFQAKKKLFRLMEKGEKKNFVSLINQDDTHSSELIKSLRSSYYTYGKSSKDFSFKINKASIFGTDFTFTSPEESVQVHLPIPGEYNVSNATASLAASTIAGFPLKDSIKALESFQSPSGRLERITNPEARFQVFVDYAHTPNALENVLKTLRAYLDKTSQVSLVFGCGGDRDKGKRSQMGQLALQLADKVILTSDNPRFENPKDIAQACLKDLPPDHGFTLELDRKKAIELALRQANPGDIVLIAGKGHENFQIVQDKKLPFSDQDIVRSFLKIPDVKA